MKVWALKLLIVACVMAVILVPAALCIYFFEEDDEGDYEGDEENPLSLDESREAGASRRRDSGGWIAPFFLLGLMG